MPTPAVRVVLFLSSYAPLFLILAIADWFDAAIVSGALIIISLGSVAILRLYLNLAAKLEPSFLNAQRTQPRGSETAGYIVTYLIPFVGLDLQSSSDLVALGALLAVIGFLHVNSNLFYINPVLNLLGFHLFEVDTEGGKPSALLTKRSYIQPGERLRVVSLGNYVLMEN